MSGPGRRFDAIVIGAGLSGLTAALVLAEAGVKVGVIAKGGGYLHFTSGCIDVLGLDRGGEHVADPMAAVERLVIEQPDHPYALAGADSLARGLVHFQGTLAAAGLPFAGDCRSNFLLPTAIGATRTACLAPAAIAAGNLAERSPILIAGFEGFRDFYPPYLAANLSRAVSSTVRHVYLEVPAFRGRRHLSPLDIARALDDGDLRLEVGRLVRANLGSAGRVGFPAVLGLERHREAVAHLEGIIGCPVFEIPTLPPSVAGIRVYSALRRQLLRLGVRVEIGFWTEGTIDVARAREIAVQSAGRPTTHRADVFVLATGGAGGGGISARPDGSLRETVFNFAVEGPRNRSAWYRERFLGREPQPINLIGVRTNRRLQPVDGNGRTIENVFVTASSLPHWDPVREQSGEGVALATAWKAAQEALTLLQGNRAQTPMPQYR